MRGYCPQQLRIAKSGAHDCRLSWRETLDRNSAGWRFFMKRPKRFDFALLSVCVVMTMFAVAQSAQAQQNWTAKVGGQNKDMGRQAEAFLPNEFWIHAGDRITWTFASGDIHTVSFLLV